MTCKDCYRHFGQPGVIDFLVSGPIWNFVMTGGQVQQTTYTVRPNEHFEHEPQNEGVGGVVCLACFDARAKKLLVPYYDGLIVLGSGCWMGGRFKARMPR